MRSWASGVEPEGSLGYLDTDQPGNQIVALVILHCMPVRHM